MFLQLLNSQHENIKFRTESTTNFISIFDVKITVYENPLHMSIWQPPTTVESDKLHIG